MKRRDFLAAAAAGAAGMRAAESGRNLLLSYRAVSEVVRKNENAGVANRENVLHHLETMARRCRAATAPGGSATRGFRIAGRG